MQSYVYRLAVLSLLVISAGCQSLAPQSPPVATANPAVFEGTVDPEVSSEVTQASVPPEGGVEKAKYIASRTAKLTGGLVLKAAGGIVVVIGKGIFEALLGTDDDDRCKQQDSDLDTLWKQGYGYNNPNSERIKNSEKSLDF